MYGKKAAKPAKRSLKDRVVVIQGPQHLSDLLEKLGERLLIVYFGSSTHQGCRKFSIFVKDLSTQPNLRNVVFAEVDVGSEDLKDIALNRQIRLLPTVEFWRDGECQETVAGGDPTKVIEMLDKIVPKGNSSSQSSFTGSQGNAKLVVFAATAALLGFVGLQVRRKRQRPH